MAKNKATKIKSILDQIDLSAPDFGAEAPNFTIEPNVKRSFETLSEELNIPVEKLYHEAFDLFLRLKSNWENRSII
ncbi:MAG: hypothetical protein JXR60_11780 [Bacteroidales bacterium]|nr:hypothetical protein [Bacteroidales bacterium]